MKKIIITVLCALTLIPLVASAQVKEKGNAKEPATKLEAFLAKKGKLLIKDFYELGGVAGRYGAKIKLDAVVLYEPGQESQRIRGIRVEVNGGGKYERSDTSFLDLEEIKSLSKAIEYMLNLSKKWKGTNREYTEVVFSTKGDFKIGFYQRGTETGAFSSSGYVGQVTCFFTSPRDLISVKDIVDRGLKLLSEK